MDSNAWDERYAGTELIWTAEPNRFLVAETAGLAPGRALDVACGEGRNAVWLAERGWTVTGVDFAAAGIAKARRLADERGVAVEWVVGDVVTSPAAARAFDLVAVFYLQLPAPERRAALRGAAAAVAAGGTLVVVAHDRANLAAGYGGPKDPAVLYAADDVVADLDGSGLEIVRAARVERPVATPEGERIALDVRVRAVRR